MKPAIRMQTPAQITPVAHILETPVIPEVIPPETLTDEVMQPVRNYPQRQTSYLPEEETEEQPVVPRIRPAQSMEPGIVAVKRPNTNIFIVIFPPYKPNNIVHMLQPPDDATVVDNMGRAYKTLLAMGADGNILLREYQQSARGQAADRARLNKKITNPRNPRALRKWLRNPGGSDIIGIDTPKVPRAIIMRRK